VKILRRLTLAVSMLALTASMTFAQTGGSMNPPAGTGTGTGGAQPPAQAVEKDIDLPLDKPILKTPPKPPEPPQPPVTPPDTPPPTIYGHDLVSENSTIVYVIDISGSMSLDYGSYTTADGKTAKGHRLDRAKAQLIKSVLSLPKNFKFNMIAFDCGTYQWNGSLVEANDANKNSAVGWVSGQQPQGATGTGPACALALKNKDNKLVVLLTDGDPNCGAGDGWGGTACSEAHRAMIRGANTQKATINVFGINATGMFKQFCMNVATDGGGSYTDVQ
jgi:hypothetical protein